MKCFYGIFLNQSWIKISNVNYWKLKSCAWFLWSYADDDGTKENFYFPQALRPFLWKSFVEKFSDQNISFNFPWETCKNVKNLILSQLQDTFLPDDSMESMENGADTTEHSKNLVREKPHDTMDYDESDNKVFDFDVNFNGNGLCSRDEYSEQDDGSFDNRFAQ